MESAGYRSKDKNGVPRTGEGVDNLLNRIEDLENATQRKDGTMSKEDKVKLDEQVPIEPISWEWIVENLV